MTLNEMHVTRLLFQNLPFLIGRLLFQNTTLSTKQNHDFHLKELYNLLQHIFDISALNRRVVAVF